MQHERFAGNRAIPSTTPCPADTRTPPLPDVPHNIIRAHSECYISENLSPSPTFTPALWQCFCPPTPCTAHWQDAALCREEVSWIRHLRRKCRHG